MRTSGLARREAGFSLTLLAVVVLLAVATIVAVIILGRSADEGQRSEQTRLKFARASEDLVSFVSLNQRLPCPADPSVDTGVSAPVGASAACTFPAGTLPWSTLGINRDDAYDAWGWKVSYRVYTGGAGNVGSLTQAGGTSAVDCDTNEPLPGGTTAQGTCRTHQDTTPAEYYGGKGLSVNDFGTVHAPSVNGDGVAFVLISHGASGLGAYTSAGTRTTLPNSPGELANTTATTAFVAQAANVRGISPDNANYFDDLLAYATLVDLITKAHVAARDWPDPAPSFASVKLDTATLTAALERPAAYGDLGQNSVRFTDARVTALSGGAGQNVTFDILGGTEGIGGAAGGAGLSSADNESVKIEFSKVAQKFALTLDQFGCRTFFGFCIDFDRVELRFYKAGIELAGALSPQTKNACRAGTGLASFSIDLGVSPAADFDRVDIKPLASIGFPGGTTTSFLVAEFKTCAAGAACVTTLDTGPALTATTGGNRC